MNRHGQPYRASSSVGVDLISDEKFSLGRHHFANGEGLSSILVFPI